MYKIKTFTENGLSFIGLELFNSSKTATAKICLDQGARLQELKFNNVSIISEQTNFDYGTSYASSILFPFASRIKGGKYRFLEKEYQFNCNDGENALHGLVYNKKFELSEPEEHKNNCAVTLNYIESDLSVGFPFKYAMSVTYTLLEDGLKVSIKVKNNDKNAFPFTLGWHPYFNSNDLPESTLAFNSDKKIEFDDTLITKGIVDYKSSALFKIEDQQLDDCFILNDNIVAFNTPSYKMEITSDTKQNYLQMYTPKDIPVIAIEPMTGVSDSFNNKIGLQVLEPDETYVVNWNLNLIKE